MTEWTEDPDPTSLHTSGAVLTETGNTTCHSSPSTITSCLNPRSTVGIQPVPAVETLLRTWFLFSSVAGVLLTADRCVTHSHLPPLWSQRPTPPACTFSQHSLNKQSSGHVFAHAVLMALLRCHFLPHPNYKGPGLLCGLSEVFLKGPGFSMFCHLWHL